MQACAWNVFSERQRERHSEREGGDSSAIYLQLVLKDILASHKPAQKVCGSICARQLTFVEGHNRNVTTLLGMNLSRNSLTVSCFGET